MGGMGSGGWEVAVAWGKKTKTEFGVAMISTTTWNKQVFHSRSFDEQLTC